MNLVIDIGNTRTKFSVCNRGEVLITVPVDEFLPSHIDILQEEYNGLNKVMLSSVKEYPGELKKALHKKFDTFIELEATTPLPIENCYKSKVTLGKDRIAAVVGAFDLFPGNNILIIDAGTAITYDLLTSDGKYMGGNISPGLEMRFKALHHFTGKLPQLESKPCSKLFGQTTEEAILAGVQSGIVYEVNESIAAFLKNLII